MADSWVTSAERGTFFAQFRSSSSRFVENDDGRQQTEAKRQESSWTRKKAPRPNRTSPCGGNRPDSEPAVLAISAGGRRSSGSSILSRDHCTVDGVRSDRANSATSPGAFSIRRV